MKLLLTSILHRVAPHKSMLTLFRPSSCLGTTKQTQSTLQPLCVLRRVLKCKECFYYSMSHCMCLMFTFSQCRILKNFRFNLRGLERNIIDWKTIEKHIHCGLQIRQRLPLVSRKKKEPLHKGKCFSVHVVTSALLCCFHRFCFGQCKFKLWCIYKLNLVSMLAHLY